MNKIILCLIMLFMVGAGFGLNQPGLWDGDRHIGDNMSFNEKIEWIQFNARNGSSFTIIVNYDDDITPISIRFSNFRVSITLKTDGEESTLNFNNSRPTAPLISIGQNVTFTVEDNIILWGMDASTSIIDVGEGGTFIMNGGMISGGSFVMNGGRIEQNLGQRSRGTRGIYRGGGVFVGRSPSNFIMNDGVIINNEVRRNSMGDEGLGAGVYVFEGTFTMNGGWINENEGGAGVYVDSGTFSLTGGTIALNSGRGVEIGMGDRTWMGGGSNSTFTMYGGIISRNAQGGVSLSGGSTGMGSSMDDRSTFIMNGGLIAGNQAREGAGVHINSGSFIMHGGQIGLNTAQNRGGGIFLSRDTEFIIHGGFIGQNEANEAGGGVFIDTRSQFTMMDGLVFANTTQGLGGGVFINAGTGSDRLFYDVTTFTMRSGDIAGNSARVGGGVFGESGSTFIKSNGTVHGSDSEVENGHNTATLGGHSVFVRDIGSINTTVTHTIDTRQTVNNGFN